ncbi:MAG: FAD-binding oxidoreductase [Alphaproteobacteria bacterium]|nr:FAD-binding oxidoreductase [Alphaproteobacteria bacterium]
MNADLFAADARLSSYWWDATPRPDLPNAALPASADVVVIGSGYTGLHAALQTARAGRHTLVLDAEDAGYGCSTRNGGQIGTSIKPSFEALAERLGSAIAAEIIREGRRSLAWIGDFIRAEQLDCDFAFAGRFHAAHTPAEFEALARRMANQPKGLEIEAEIVPRAEQHTELGTDAYHGGVVYTRHATLDPARYHHGLLARVQAAGAGIHAHCPATAIAGDGQGFTVATPRGAIRARDVVVATNGYTGPLAPWLQRRVIPIGSYIIATEPIAPELMARLMPRNRAVSDTRRIVYYYRASPDRRRILFGGRVSFRETDPRNSGPKLHADMAAIFPELASLRISHSWMGFVAYTFDELMHLGRHEGIHYAMGYCGSGVGMGSYLGMRIGQQVLGLAEGRTAFDSLPFRTRPFYTGNPWFLAPSVAYYRWRDKRG